MAMPEPSPKRRRRWASLSLRGLMSLILVVGLLMGWKARKASLQRRAAAAIYQAGGYFVYDFQSATGDPIPTGSSAIEPDAPGWLRRLLGNEYFQEITGVGRSSVTYAPVGEPENTPTLGSALQMEEQAKVDGLMAVLTTLDLAKLTGLTDLDLFSTRITDAGLAHLEGMTAMERLSLSHLPITDAGLVHLSGMASLRTLVLSETLVTGNGLAHLSSPSTLFGLKLAGSPVTDDGLKVLSGLTGLTTLDLSRTKITDAGLPHLIALKSLQFLDLDETAVTESGLASLRPGWNPSVQAKHGLKP